MNRPRSNVRCVLRWVASNVFKMIGTARRKILLLMVFAAGCVTSSGTELPASNSPRFEAFVSDQFDFDNAAETERRFQDYYRVAVARHDDLAAAELLTQVARAQGVQDHVQDANATLRSGAFALANPRLRARFALESGRLLRRGGDRDSAAQHFQQAFEIAQAAHLDALAVDAAHMMALISSGDDTQHWVERGLAIAQASHDPVARHWVGTICFNWATSLSERGDHQAATTYFGRSLTAREHEGDRDLIRTTQLALAHELGLTDQTQRARVMLLRLLQEARATGANTDAIQAELDHLSAAR